jgi:RNA polymerase sigma factor (sigma-70 family)
MVIVVTCVMLSYEELIGPVEARMMRSIWRIVRDPQEAEDTMQDALMIIWKRLDRVRAHPNPHALILKICTDASYDTLRKRKRHARREDPDVLHRLQAHGGVTVPDEVTGIETEKEILAAVARLPKKQAVAILMRLVQEQPYEAIARAMGCAESTVRIHVLRGRQRLSRWLAHLKEVIK